VNRTNGRARRGSDGEPVKWLGLLEDDRKEPLKDPWACRETQGKERKTAGAARICGAGRDGKNREPIKKQKLRRKNIEKTL